MRVYCVFRATCHSTDSSLTSQLGAKLISENRSIDTITDTLAGLLLQCCRIVWLRFDLFAEVL